MSAAIESPILRPIADSGVLVEFGDCIDDVIHQRVLQFDAAVSQAGLIGVTELVPSYTSVLVSYDPLQTDYETLSASLREQLQQSQTALVDSHQGALAHWQIPACYSARFAPDLAHFADLVGLSTEQVIQHHCNGKYKVYMYGFAPGFAYLGGVPDAIQYPRKPEPVMNVAPGSLIIAGPQALITTVLMPSGWWNIGRTARTPLQDDSERPFLFAVGDTVEFVQVSEAEFLAHGDASL